MPGTSHSVSKKLSFASKEEFRQPQPRPLSGHLFCSTFSPLQWKRDIWELLLLLEFSFTHQSTKKKEKNKQKSGVGWVFFGRVAAAEIKINPSNLYFVENWLRSLSLMPRKPFSPASLNFSEVSCWCWRCWCCCCWKPGFWSKRVKDRMEEGNLFGRRR